MRFRPIFWTDSADAAARLVDTRAPMNFTARLEEDRGRIRRIGIECIEIRIRKEAPIHHRSRRPSPSASASTAASFRSADTVPNINLLFLFFSLFLSFSLFFSLFLSFSLFFFSSFSLLSLFFLSFSLFTHTHTHARTHSHTDLIKTPFSNLQCQQITHQRLLSFHFKFQPQELPIPLPASLIDPIITNLKPKFKNHSQNFFYVESTIFDCKTC